VPKFGILHEIAPFLRSAHIYEFQCNIPGSDLCSTICHINSLIFPSLRLKAVGVWENSFVSVGSAGDVDHRLTLSNTVVSHFAWLWREEQTCNISEVIYVDHIEDAFS